MSLRIRRAGSRGFTLLELLVASALMAILALLSWRGLESVLVSRDRIVLASDELRSLTMAFSQMDEDLRRSWPVRLLRLPVPSIGFSVAGEQAQPTLELIREATTASEPIRLQQVAYRVRNGVLERGFGALTLPSGGTGSAGSPGGSGSPAFAGPGGSGTDTNLGLIWQPILVNVSMLEMQGWIAGQGWLPAAALAGQLAGAGSRGAGSPQAGGVAQGVSGTVGASASGPAAVTGLQVRVIREDGSQLVRVFPVKD